MLAGVHMVSELSPEPGESVVRFDVEDGVIVDAVMTKAIVSVPENDDEERMIREQGLHTGLEWHDEEMLMSDYWMPSKL